MSSETPFPYTRADYDGTQLVEIIFCDDCERVSLVDALGHPPDLDLTWTCPHCGGIDTEEERVTPEEFNQLLKQQGEDEMM